MADQALVVGIEVYPTGFANSLQGPALDAMRFALWLHQVQGVPAENIRLLCAPAPDWQGELLERYEATAREVERAGIIPRTSLAHREIMAVFETELLNGPLEEGALWIYWSGHGVTFPGSRDSVLCADLQNGQPTFVYLQELRDALRSREFRRYKRQFLIVDACSEYMDPATLRMHKLRGPDAWKVSETPTQIELSAVPQGKRAQAAPGGSVFSAALLQTLGSQAWPDDLAALHRQLRAAVLAHTHDAGSTPSIRILTPTWAEGYKSGGDERMFDGIVALLSRCTIAFQGYRPLYAQTMSTLCQGLDVPAAATVPQIAEALLDLQPEPDFGGYPHALVQFLVRVVRRYTTDAGPIQEWLEQLPRGSLKTLAAELDAERGRLILTLEVSQANRASASEYPVRVSATLSDAGFRSVLGQWPESGELQLRTATELERATRTILEQALDKKPDDDQGMDVHVCADLPFFGYPWQALCISPDTPEEAWSEHLGFVVRWRERRSRNARLFAEAWRKRSDRLRYQPCRNIPIVAPIRVQSGEPARASEEGLFCFSAAPCGGTRAGPSSAELVLLRELKKGLSLASWPLPAEPDGLAGGDAVAGGDAPGEAAGESLERVQQLKQFFTGAGLRMLDAVPEALMEERGKSPWARKTVLFLDLAPTAEAKEMHLEEAHQL